MNDALIARTSASLEKFANWLDGFGETSQDHQDFYASKVGRAAKNLYYRHKLLGTAAVMPMVFCEAFLPSTRRFFYPRMRLPIADAHFAMGFALMHRFTKKKEHYEKAVHFLEVLKSTRCPAYEHHGWGYPFDWQTSSGVLKQGTPLITTTPYCYEAFEYVYRIDGRQEWRDILHSIAEHTLLDYKDIETGPGAATCTYTPDGGQYVVNASSYRAFTLTSAWREFGDDRYWETAQRNINFVLQNQQADGSWLYAMDGKRGFIDHFHTCFVLKGLVKIEKMTGHEGCSKAIERGIDYYLKNLFNEQGLPRPFAKAPRMTVYKQELYDCAECLNLGMLLRGRFPELDKAIERLVNDLLENWQRSNGAFRSRRLLVGWDSVPMHRWGGSEIFRALALIPAAAAGHEVIKAK
ncbi:MAG: hypothetical protein QM790_06950 [Nibricoccus sp.]